MSKLKVKIKDSQILVKSKLDKTIVINQREVELFNSKFIRGLMRPKVVGNKKIEYSASGSITLQKYLQSGISKKDFYVVFAQLIECVKKIEHYGLNINNLVMDTEYTFYNEITREVQFLYQPLNNPNIENNIFSYIYRIASETVLNLDESNAFLNDLVSFCNSVQVFSIAVIEAYINKVYPQVYKTVKKMQPGDSVNLNPTGRTYFEKKYDTVVDGEDTNRFVDDNKNNKKSYVYVKEILNNKMSSYDQDTNILSNNDTYEVGTDLLIEEEKASSGSYDYEEGTTVLDGSEGTTVLQTNIQPFPYLIRLNAYEKIVVNKPVFRIGKEKSYVDYFVMNNNAVSRIHADIITQNGQYFIKDNNSTNHTFVNGTMVPLNQKVQIFDGDAIMLANEPFEFHAKV